MLQQELCVCMVVMQKRSSPQLQFLQLVILAEDKKGSSLNIRCRHTREGEETETGKDSKKQLTHQGHQHRPTI